MYLQTRVKISTVNNLSDARYGAGMGAAMLGFSVEQNHAHYLTPTQLSVITQWVEGVAIVGELHTPSITALEAVLKNYTLDYIQLDASCSPSITSACNLPVILRVGLQGHESLAMLQQQLAPWAPHAQYFLLEAAGQHDPTTIVRMQSVINQLAHTFPLLQGYHVTTHVLPDLLKVPLKGIAIPGDTTLRPGHNSFDELADILDWLTVDDPSSQKI